MVQFEILDVIKIKRKTEKINTRNKSCTVLSCRIKGKSLFSCKEGIISAEEGDILYIPRSSDYSQETDGEEIVCLHLSLSCGDGRLKAIKTDDPNKIRSLFLRAYEIWTEKAPRYEYKCAAIVYEILSMGEIVDTPEEKYANPLLKCAMEYLNAHIYDEDFSLSALCRAVPLSHTYLNKLFKSKFSCSPIVYVNMKRIEKAKRLLKSGEYTNAEICSLCGYTDIKYFYVAFKKYANTTTKKWLQNQNVAQ